MAKLVNIAKMNTATTGTGTLTLGTAEDGYLSFADAGVVDGDVVTYTIREGLAAEVGRGTYTAAGTTLSRDTVLESTNGGAKINLAGLALVAVTIAAEDVIEPPASSTDNALVRFDGTSGRKVQNSGAILDDSNNLSGLLSILVAATVAATHAGTFRNTADAASVAALRIEGDRATPAAQDEVYASFYLSNAAGTQKEYARIAGVAADITNGAEQGALDFGLSSAGAVSDLVRLTTVAFRPLTNDSHSLGTVTTSWADLFLASGGTINWNNGNVVLTHSAGALTMQGASTFTMDYSGSFAGLHLFRSDTHGSGQNIALIRNYGKDSAGNTTEYSRIATYAEVATDASEYAHLRFGVNNGGTLTEYLVLVPGFFVPAVNDGTALGSASNSFSDLYLASGGTINFNNSNLVLTHSAGALTCSGIFALDSAFYFVVSSGTPVISFDSNDYLQYDRTNNVLSMVIGGSGAVLHSDANAGRCRVWCNFTGTGTVTLNDDFNVSSITDNGTGDYTVNFTNALNNANYAVQITGEGGAPTNPSYWVWTTGSRTTTTVRIRLSSGGALADFNAVFVTIHGN